MVLVGGKYGKTQKEGRSDNIKLGWKGGLVKF
jgi:hypothetical protein